MEEDARREAAMAASACLQPNFVPKTASITPTHLSKLKELRKRRLQLKSKPKTDKKIKGKGKTQKKEIVVDVAAESCPDEQKSRFESSSSTQKKRKKLHWGLDTKEKWEMKANM